MRKKNIRLQTPRFYFRCVRGPRHWITILWNFLLVLSSLFFANTGLSGSPLGASRLIHFFPQGLAMYFYGTILLYIALYGVCILCLNIGSGFNEIDYEIKVMLIFRWGFPGRNRKLLTSILMRDIAGVIYSPTYSVFKRPYINLQLIDGQQFRLIDSIAFQTSKQVEMEAAALAQALHVPLIYIE